MKQKMNTTNNQTAFEYALYMIAASYFDKAICKTKVMEQKMHLQYVEQKKEQQYQLEDMCISFLEETLVPAMPQKLWQQRAEVYLIKDKSGACTEVRFATYDYMLRIFAEYAGKKSKISYEILAQSDRIKIRKKRNISA